MPISLDSMIDRTESLAACVLQNLRYRWQEWRRGPEQYVDIDRRRQTWLAVRSTVSESVSPAAQHVDQHFAAWRIASAASMPESAAPSMSSCDS